MGNQWRVILGALLCAASIYGQDIAAEGDQIAAQAERMRAQVKRSLDDVRAQFSLTGPASVALFAQADGVRAEADRARAKADHERGVRDRLASDYRRGKEALDQRKYERAIEEFDKVIEAKGQRADGAFYWKAYSLNKIGRRPDAQAALEELRKGYPNSAWLNDAKVLAAEVSQASGQGVPPESESDEDLKLLAINTLINNDPDRTLPLLEKLLGDPKNSPKLKERALFVLAQSHSDKAREILAKYAKGGSNPDVQMKAVEYLGVFGSPESRQILSEVYASSTDPALKRSVLRSFMMARDRERLLAAAKSERDADLRRDAIQFLGISGGQSDLAQLYTSETSPAVKETILNALLMGGDTDKLIEIAKSEKDPQLRLSAIHKLSVSHREKSADALAAMYASETDKRVKVEIVHALFQQGNAKPLVDIARKETDPELKKELVHRLSLMHSKDATDYMMELLNK